MDPSSEEHHANGLYLSRDIIFVILLQLPAEWLWTVARNVCVAWADIIRDPDFVKAHYLNSKDVLLVQEHNEPHFMQSLEKVDRIFRAVTTGSYFPCLGLPSNSCRGLIIFICGVIFNNRNSLLIHVANPMTRQVLRLPYLGQVRYKFIKLLYIHQRMEYVAVCIIAGRSDKSDFHMLALSLGADVLWRKLSHIPAETLKAMSSLSVLSNRSGVPHAIQDRSTVAAVGGCLYVLQNRTTIAVINLLDETVSYIQFPHGKIFKPYGIQEKGDCMSCMSIQGDDLVVWMLKGDEWLQVCRINEERVLSAFLHSSSTPIGWLDNCLVFGGQDHLLFWVYDADSAEARGFTLNHEYFWQNCLIHRNTLLRW